MEQSKERMRECFSYVVELAQRYPDADMDVQRRCSLHWSLSDTKLLHVHKTRGCGTLYVLLRSYQQERRGGAGRQMSRKCPRRKRQMGTFTHLYQLIDIHEVDDHLLNNFHGQ